MWRDYVAVRDMTIVLTHVLILPSLSHITCMSANYSRVTRLQLFIRHVTALFPPYLYVTRLCYTLIYSQICVTHSYIHWYIHWYIHSHIQSYIHWYHSYVMWLCHVPHIHTSWDCITHSYIHTYMLHAHMFTDVFIDVLWCPPGHSIPARLPPTHVQHDSFIRVMWRSHMRNTTHPYAL